MTHEIQATPFEVTATGRRWWFAGIWDSNGGLVIGDLDGDSESEAEQRAIEEAQRRGLDYVVLPADQKVTKV